MDTGSLLLIFSLAILVGLKVFRPFFSDFPPNIIEKPPVDNLGKAEERLTDLALEKDRLFSAMQELDADQELQKIPDEVYFSRRNEFRNAAAGILKQIDDLDAQAQALSVADSEPAVENSPIRFPEDKMDEIEEMIAARRRSRHEKSAGFCHRCGKVIQKSDQFCPTCGSKVSG